MWRDLFFMPKNQLNKEEMYVRVMKLKTMVDDEGSDVWQGERNLAHKYLNKVLDIITEYRYYLNNLIPLVGMRLTYLTEYLTISLCFLVM